MKKIFPFIFLLTIGAKAQLVVQNGATVTTTGNAVVCLLNSDLQNNGTINQLSGTGKFIFNGNSNNAISGTTQPNFAIVEIAKTGTAQLILQQNMGINENVLFTSGNIDLNNKNIILAPTAMLTGENETSRITGATGGYVEISDVLNAPTTVNLGNLGATISSTQNLGNTTIRRGHKSQSGIGGGGSSILRYYSITPTNNSGLNATLRINYFDSELNGLPEANLVQLKSTNGTNWTNMGFTNKNTMLNYVEKTALDGFSMWTLSNQENTLPLVMGQMNIDCSNGFTKLIWTTLQESNQKEFIVQTSGNGLNWQNIGTVAAIGNSNTPKQYSFTNTFNTDPYFRLAQIDRNENIQYSSILKSNCNTDIKDEVSVFPNPAQDKVNIQVNVSATSTLHIRLIDNKGATIHSKNILLTKGVNSVPLQLSNIAQGNYQLHLNWNNGQNTKTLKLNKL